MFLNYMVKVRIKIIIYKFLPLLITEFNLVFSCLTKANKPMTKTATTFTCNSGRTKKREFITFLIVSIITKCLGLQVRGMRHQRW